MATIQTILQGFSVNTSEGGLGYCAVTLLRGERITLVDVAHIGRRALLLERIRAAGLEPGDIDRVVLTHAHWDHCHNLDCFPNAEVLLLDAEYQYTHSPHPQDWATPIWTGDILKHCRVTTLRDGDEIERGVRAIATPGHSPGSLTVLVETPEGIAGLVGDALPHRIATTWMGPRLVFWDEDEGRRSAERIVESCRTIYPGHDRPFRVENGGFHYIEPTRIDILYAPTDEEGRRLSSFSDEPMPTTPVIVPSARRSAGAGTSDG